MHLTTLEIAFSRTPEEINSLVAAMRPAIPGLVNFTFEHRCRLVKPMLSYDLAGIALSFLPAAGELVTSPPPVSLGPHGVLHPGADGVALERTDRYTYHHLRRDVFTLARATGIEIGSRYVVPSAHITLGRYLKQDDYTTPEMRESWIKTIEGINDWLEREVWGKEAGEFIGEWIVGQERGLDSRSGALWYGGGRSIMSGEGF